MLHYVDVSAVRRKALEEPEKNGRRTGGDKHKDTARALAMGSSPFLDSKKMVQKERIKE